ncbi:uncharacterized protein LOC117106886 [Anneissia japonica]|uniref:uncharacterized protein LOC117106886 n=1 Tax=Anneissia japonica TaxID=1529436 RepID=UPI0014256C3B|nr:uncharacterized protein LOC117106886 [Anneissia japonica]
MCLLQEYTTNMETSCAVYDIRIYRLIFYGLVITLNLSGLVFVLLAYLKMPNNRQNRKEKQDTWYSLRSRGDSFFGWKRSDDEFEYYSPPQTLTTFTSTLDRSGVDIIRSQDTVEE